MNTTQAAEQATVTVECFKCLGTGRIAGFSHVSNGVCFQCNGAKVCEFRSFKPGFNRHFIEFGDGFSLAFGALCDSKRDLLLTVAKSKVDAAQLGATDAYHLAAVIVATKDPRVESRALAAIAHKPHAAAVAAALASIREAIKNGLLCTP